MLTKGKMHLWTVIKREHAADFERFIQEKKFLLKNKASVWASEKDLLEVSYLLLYIYLKRRR